MVSQLFEHADHWQREGLTFTVQFHLHIAEGLSIKDVGSQGIWSRADKGRGSSDADVCIFCAKNFGFFEIYVCPHGQRGMRVEPVRTFFGQGRVKFLWFCADVFCGRSLQCICV